MQPIIKQREHIENYFVELARQPDSFRIKEENILSTLSEKKNQQLLHTPFVISDHSSMQFLFVSKNINKHFVCTDKDFLREGMDLCKYLIHPDDNDRNLNLCRDLFNTYFSFPLEERLTYKYCNDFRFKSYQGKYIWLLHEVFFLKADDEGKPMLSCSTFTDITALKKDNTLNLYVGRYEDGINYKMAYSKKYPLHLPSIKLSRKEIEILKMIGDGLLSKQIAEKLHISFHTVNTHRRNMLEKTNTSTSGGLISYAQEHGFI